MIAYMHAAFLGLIQGITEFLPISSSGHLIIVRDVLHIATPDALGFDAVLQLASGLAVMVYFKADISAMVRATLRAVFRRVSPEDRAIEANVVAAAIALGTIPAVLAGIFLEGAMETVFRSVDVVAITLILGSLLMWYAERSYKKRMQTNQGFAPLSIKRGFIIGLYQVLALIPGVSRSGATISGGLLLGLSRDQIGRFTFLLAIPVIVGAGLKKLFDGGVHVTPELLVGTIVSFVVSLAVIHFLLQYLRKRSLMPFVVYRIVVAVLLIVLL